MSLRVTPAGCIYRQMWETHGSLIEFQFKRKFVCSAPKWLIPFVLVHFIDFQFIILFLITPLKSRTLIIVSNLFILNTCQVSPVSISISFFSCDKTGLLSCYFQDRQKFLLMEGQLRITVFGKGTARRASVVLRRFVHAIKP